MIDSIHRAAVIRDQTEIPYMTKRRKYAAWIGKVVNDFARCNELKSMACNIL